MRRVGSLSCLWTAAQRDDSGNGSLVRIESLGPRADRTRQGARHLPGRRETVVDPRHRSDVGLRRHPARPDSGQRHRAHGDLELLVRQAQRRHCEPSNRHGSGHGAARRRRSRRGAGSRRRGPRPEAVADRGRGPRLPDRLRVEGLLQDRPCFRRSATAGPRARRPAQRADLHAEHEGGTRAPRREHLDDRRAQPARHGARAEGVRRVVTAVCPCHGVRPRTRHHHRRHEVRVRPRRSRGAARHGRDAHARLLALLAGRQLPSRILATELRQAVRPRLSRDARLEQDGPWAAAARRRDRANPGEIHRSARTPHGPRAGGSTPGPPRPARDANRPWTS
jgi:hypothetical protein